MYRARLEPRLDNVSDDRVCMLVSTVTDGHVVPAHSRLRSRTLVSPASGSPLISKMYVA
jgi:hypothetical protein